MLATFATSRTHCLLRASCIEDLLGVAIESGQRADGADEDPHRVRVVLEPFHQLLDVLVQQRVLRDGVDPGAQLGLGGQLAEQDQVRHFEVVAVLRQLLDGVAAVAQNPLVAVDVGDGAAARGGVQECRVVGHQAGVLRRRL